ncbi:putative transmembrane protein [Toxoplasma gondii GAB2-2007-GAL-DOM2]|uniref:Transmembrane protein n=7 Tax=Toxoplasma gondii TaxID=5811 RepID=S7UX63_TOXGG|nr:hypothetical protein TGGT1_227130 [Toxoplasma gondii GT1]KAF4640747.1 hypothetical protein TGRH88_046730 [Toxoplasma gondii]KFG42401.1 putative transmembrane protein [Toxoplasma gondii p89]KFG45185.1 putative transmembrane protein [Toxoplasma gondii GAB2-2007-GAL-DOM2]KFG51950.1 putative transmembrane protein [Toxoplasma gondii FOU]PUA91048.1 putative transmembrane protein [Toxoplasma gondii TgCATBr9]RQX74418.1 putative transmembrane protein [Toxoplasma gondii CAST]
MNVQAEPLALKCIHTHSMVCCHDEVPAVLWRHAKRESALYCSCPNPRDCSSNLVSSYAPENVLLDLSAATCLQGSACSLHIVRKRGQRTDGFALRSSAVCVLLPSLFTVRIPLLFDFGPRLILLCLFCLVATKRNREPASPGAFFRLPAVEAQPQTARRPAGRLCTARVCSVHLDFLSIVKGKCLVTF